MSLKPWKRLKNHFYGIKRGASLVHSAVRRYGPDEFSFDVLLVASPIYCYEMEPLIIAAMQSQVPEGYNICVGGRGKLGRPKGWKQHV